MRRLILIVALMAAMCGTAWGQAGMTRHQPFWKSGRSSYPTTDTGVSIKPHSCWSFDAAVAGTYPDECSGVPYTMTVNGAPTLNSNDGTYPNGLGGAAGKAWNFDGTNDYITRVDDGSFDMDLVNNPGGDFSVQCVVTPDTVAAGTDYIIAKNTPTANQRGWRIMRGTANILFGVSDDGTAVAGHWTEMTKANALAAHRPAFITVTYNYVADGTSEGRIYVDNLAVQSDNTMDGPVYNNTGPFTIGADGDGNNTWSGLIHDCKIYKGWVISEEQHDRAFAEFQGRSSTVGGVVRVGVASASPPAIMQKPCATADGCFIDQPANSAYIGIHGLASAVALTSKWWRGSAETCAAGHPTGWTIVENGGGGAGTVVIDCDATTSAHGGTSIKFTSDGAGAPKNANAVGACQTNWIGQDVSLISWGYSSTGAASCRMQIVEYDTAVCGTYLGETTVWGLADPGASWTQVQGTKAAATWNGATSSWLPRITCHDTGTAYVAWFDAAMALQAPATFDTDQVCTLDADADAVCTDVITSGSNPLTPADWTVQGFYNAAQDGAETTPKAIFHVPATVGNANQIDVFHDTDTLTCRVYDSGGVNHDATVALAYSVGESWQWRITHTDIGQVGCCTRQNGTGAWTCGAEAAGATMDGITTTYYVGNNAGAGGNNNEKRLQFFRRKLP